MPDPITLEPAFSERALTRDDLSAVVGLMNNCLAADITFPTYVRPETTALFWEVPGVHPETSYRLIFDSQHNLVAYGYAIAPSPHHNIIYQEVMVHPHVRTTHIGPYLIQNTLADAQRFLPHTKPNQPVLVQSTFRNLSQWEASFIQDFGFSLTRQMWKLSIDLTKTPIIQPPAPEGIVLRHYHPDDSRALHGALETIFSGHWNYNSMSYDQWLKYTTQGAENDRTLWHVAFAEEELVGFITADPTNVEDPEAGYIHLIGVQPAWRERGLGSTLLQQVLYTFAHRGFPRVIANEETDADMGVIPFYQKVGMQVVDRMATYTLDLHTYFP